MARTNKQRGGNSWIFWGTGLLIVVVVVVVGLLTIPTGSDEEPDEEPAAENTDSPAPEPVEPKEEDPTETGGEGDGPARCEDMDADSAFPTEAPDFAWEDFDGVEDFALPVSDEHGPAVQEDGFWRCFSQTPAGAAFAAPSLWLSFGLGGHYEAAVDSPGAEAALPDDLEAERESANGLVRGFRIVDSSDEEATVQVWLAPPDGSVDLYQEFHLTWNDEARDWRLDLAGGMGEFEELTNTADFTEWR